MKVIKFLFLSLFSFAVISCSNIYNQGDASLEICLPGSPDSDARFIDMPDPGMFNQYLLSSVFEIIIDGPIYLEKIVNYGESCSFNNLKCGRYKVSIYNWSSNPNAPQAMATLYCYGERDIAVTGGKNTKSIDIYALTINNIKEITGGRTTLMFMYGGDDIPDEISLFSKYEVNFTSFTLDNCKVCYKGGYTENYSAFQSFYNLINLTSSWAIYKNGNVVCQSTDFGSEDEIPEKNFDFYPHQDGYEIIYTYDINGKIIQLKSSLDFAYGY